MTDAIDTMDRETDIFAYLDYRLFLHDLIAELKRKKQYKVRSFAFKANLRTPGYMRMIIDGKRNLTMEVAQRFCRALEIRGREKEYFEKLVYYSHEKDPDLKKEYFNELLALRPRTPAYTVGQGLSRYFSRPYYACIQEMVALADFQEDHKWIAARCRPGIRVAQVKEAIDTLLELGLLERNDTGKLVQTQRLIQTEDKHTQIAETYHYHEAMIDLARKSLSELKQHERDYFAVTLPMNDTLYPKIVQAAYQFRDQVIKMFEEYGDDGKEVYQMNFQLFPMTKVAGEKS
jgi:uncharacterized protein (TIGR02147 family)